MEPMETETRPLPQYRCHCVECGGVVVYADDSTYTVKKNTRAPDGPPDLSGL